MLNYTVVEAIVKPIELVTLDEVKDHLRVSKDIDLEDEIIKVYIEAAVDSASQYVGAPVNSSTVVINAPCYSNKIVFPVRPVTAITSINYANKEGVNTHLEATNYKAVNYRHENKVILLNAFDTQADNEEAITITVQCGYTAETLPGSIRRAILLEIADMYTYREDRKEITNKASEAALRPYRIYG